MGLGSKWQGKQEVSVKSIPLVSLDNVPKLMVTELVTIGFNCKPYVLFCACADDESEAGVGSVFLILRKSQF